MNKLFWLCQGSQYAPSPPILDIWQSFQYISGIKYARVLNMPLYSYYSIIIIVTNFIMLEFLSARFVYPGTMQLTILSFFTTS